MSIPKDCILMLSGVSCVGKTTTAYEIVKSYPEFRRVAETDIIRTIIRSSIASFPSEQIIDHEEIMNTYGALFESITNSNLETNKLQSIQLLPYIKEIVLRQQRRKIPTILEGAGIIPSTYFPNNQALDWITNSVVFVNLFLSNENQHIIRRQSRSMERDYFEDSDETERIVLKARSNKNIAIHMETLKLSKQFDNVISLDVADSTPASIAETIMKLISNYFYKISNN